MAADEAVAAVCRRLVTFRRLSVFRGAFTLEAAENVTGAGLDQLGALLDHGLIKPVGDSRFFLLETIRGYARERLDRAGETEEWSLRHGNYFLAQLEERRPLVFGSERGALLAWFGEEEDNLRAGSKEVIGSALYTIARIASVRGDPARAADLLERALEEGTDDEWTRALLHAGLGAAHVEVGSDAAARDAFREAREGFRAAGDEANDVACAIGLAELVEPVLEWTR